MRKIFICFICIFLFSLFPTTTYALDNYLDIYSSSDIVLESLNFYDLEYDRVSVNNFTISGLVYNFADSEIINIEICLYDSSKILLAKKVDAVLFSEGYMTYEVTINYEDVDSINFYSLNINDGSDSLILNNDDIIEKSNSDFYIYIIPLAFLLIVFMILFITNNRNFKLTDCYPKNDLNSVEFAYKYRDKFYTDYIYTMLIYLATKGYISIEHTDGYKINKVKEYDGDNELEKMFFDGLFITRIKENNHNYTVKSGVITFKSASSVLVKTILRMSLKIENIKSSTKINKNNAYFMIIPLVLISYLVIVYYPLTAYYSNLLAIVIISLSVFLLFGLMILLLMDKFLWLKGLIIGSLFGSIFYIIPAIMEDERYFVGFFTNLVCIVGLIVCFSLFKQRQDKFKKNLFLESISNMNVYLLEKLALSNPNYIYDVLPFIMVLNLTDKYLIEFENYLLDVPSWYIDNMAIDLRASFMKFMYYGYNDFIDSINFNLNVKK